MSRPPLSISRILAWADAYHGRTGRWPKMGVRGYITGSLGEKWLNIDMALRLGLRGLPGDSSLARLLAEHRGVRNHMALPALSVGQILAWVDTHHARTGAWPTKNSGRVVGAPGETWMGVDGALLQGHRGQKGGSSLAGLLQRTRGVRNRSKVPRLTEKQILRWADAHQRRTGQWPKTHSGPITAAPGETWLAVHTALHKGQRGLPGGATLARLLARRRGARNHKALPPLTESKILAWADAHYQRTGQWPKRHSGPIVDAPGETWMAVEAALDHGQRRLPGGSSLAQLLAERRGVRHHHNPPRLSVAQILRWARAHWRRTGQWPNREAGPLTDAPGETWAMIDRALRKGRRGLPGKTTLFRLLSEQDQGRAGR